MATVEIKLPKYVAADQDRHENWRYYVRRKGHPKVRLHEKPGSDAFAKEVETVLAHLAGEAGTFASGTFGALCQAYYKSKTYKALDKSTQNWRRRALDVICACEDGHKAVALMQPKHIRALRNELEDKPGLANRRLDALKALFKWAVDHEEADSNPAREISPLSHRDKGFHTWTIEEVEQYEVRHPIGTKARLAMALMLYTAGRREDAVRLGPQHIRTTPAGKRVQFVQAKNEHRKPVPIDVPLHPDLETVIAGTPAPVIPKGKPRPLSFLVTEHGKSFQPAGFGNWFRARCVEAGVPGRAHGLRKALLTRLAEGGATPHQIQSWSGHSKLEEVELYTRAANRASMADAGLLKLQGGTKAE